MEIGIVRCWFILCCYVFWVRYFSKFFIERDGNLVCRSLAVWGGKDYFVIELGINFLEIFLFWGNLLGIEWVVEFCKVIEMWVF